MSDPVILGIDPGASGGIAWVRGAEVKAVPMPCTPGDTLALLRDLSSGLHVAYIEHVVGFIPGGGAGAMFTFGEGFGYLQGCLDALGYRTIRVRPQAWQKALALGKPEKIKAGEDLTPAGKKLLAQQRALRKGDWKRKLLAEAQRRFPECNVTLKTADALLILEFGRQQLTKS
jgi:hypothetical protein